MFRVAVEREFCAAHAIRIAGEVEPVHGHNWFVRVEIAGEALDEDGLLVDFHAVERSLGEIVGPFHNRSLNEAAPFDRVNPTAEHVARHIAERLAESGVLAGGGMKARGVRVASVSVREAPGCVATYIPM
jgi:6-pyruvoyltetrahydropterin/6-carboxytetrahydropterin synthase